VLASDVNRSTQGGDKDRVPILEYLIVTRRVHRTNPISLFPLATQAAYKLFWIVMLLVHAGAIVSVCQQIFTGAASDSLSGLLVRAFVLLVSAALFALKLADVRWLRINSGWRSSVGSLIIVALLHVGAVQRAVNDDLLIAPIEVGAVVILGSALGIDELRRRLVPLIALAFVRVGQSRIQHHSILARLRCRLWDNEIKPLISAFLTLVVPTRAPPV